MLDYPCELPLEGLTEGLTQVEGDELIPGAVWYEGEEAGEGLVYRFPAGMLAQAAYLTADMLLDGTTLTSFTLYLQEGEDGPRFGLNFGLLNQCSARMRVPLEAVNQNRWRYPREGAWLKPRCREQRVDLSRVDRATLEIERKGPAVTRFCMTPLTVTAEAPPFWTSWCCPRAPCSMNWARARCMTGLARPRAPTSWRHGWRRSLPPRRNRRCRRDTRAGAGGWSGRSRRPATSARTTTASAGGLSIRMATCSGRLGLDCVRFGIDSVVRGAGGRGGVAARGRRRLRRRPHPRRATGLRLPQGQPHPRLWPRGGSRQLGDHRAIASSGHSASTRWPTGPTGRSRRARCPTPARWTPVRCTRCPQSIATSLMSSIPSSPRLQRSYAGQLAETVDDPAFIGYFLMNEPTWGFAQETPAAGMLYNTDDVLFARGTGCAILRIATGQTRRCRMLGASP